ncbi:MAG TPA: adenylate/guanylate cyclase domain-containing protein [Gaiellaceae bacterium]
MTDFPTGTLTLLFADVEGSTLLVRTLGARYSDALATYRRIVRGAIADADGQEIDTQGDSFFVVFERSGSALEAAIEVQRRLAKEDWPEGAELRARIGIHTGEPALGDEGYLGLDVHRAARICSAAHGGQVLLSQTTRDLCGEGGPPGAFLDDLGEHQLKDLPQPERLFQLAAPGLASSFPSPKTLDRQETDASPFLGRERELGSSAHAAVSAAKGRLAAKLARRLRPTQRGFADLGWDVRALLVSAPAPIKSALEEFGRELFVLGRSVVDCDRYLGPIDRKMLERRLDEYREMGVISRRATAEAEAQENRLKLLDDLVDERDRSTGMAKEVERKIGELRARLANSQAAPSAEILADLGTIVARTRAAETELQRRLAKAQEALGDAGIALKHTRHRGVFRAGNRYVVPFFDELGIEQRRTFGTLGEAHAFSRTLRLEKTPAEFTDSSVMTTDRSPWGAEQGIVKPRDERRR